MKKNLFFAFAIIVVSCNEKTDKEKSALAKASYSAEGKTVMVYTTADSSNLRLAATDTLQFKQMGQPMETQLCVFVDPAKQYQSYFGIGAALTDASAETYAKLPANKQADAI